MLNACSEAAVLGRGPRVRRAGVPGAALAQQRAPQNESIRQEDLRADLFFLAGDSLRGRLTDTEENRATADFIRSRFERMGLKPAAAEQLATSSPTT